MNGDKSAGNRIGPNHRTKIMPPSKKAASNFVAHSRLFISGHGWNTDETRIWRANSLVKCRGTVAGDALLVASSGQGTTDLKQTH